MATFFSNPDVDSRGTFFGEGSWTSSPVAMDRGVLIVRDFRRESREMRLDLAVDVDDSANAVAGLACDGEDESFFLVGLLDNDPIELNDASLIPFIFR